MRGSGSVPRVPSRCYSLSSSYTKKKQSKTWQETERKRAVTRAERGLGRFKRVWTISGLSEIEVGKSRSTAASLFVFVSASSSTRLQRQDGTTSIYFSHGHGQRCEQRRVRRRVGSRRQTIASVLHPALPLLPHSTAIPGPPAPARYSPSFAAPDSAPRSRPSARIIPVETGSKIQAQHSALGGHRADRTPCRSLQR